ncbi:MAG TPA: 50S ribosomal protein L11 methyltransferase [Anaerolineae bacterium]|nr:50S ribosomal protein L11 methyltransferase [Anaerolineae bacterium]
MTNWLEISVTTLSENATEAATDVLQLFALGDEGVAIEQIGDPDDVDPQALLPETLVKLYVDGGRDSAELRQTITQALQDRTLPRPHFNIIKEEDWANAWKDNFKPLRIGKRFWIEPSWIKNSAPHPDDIVLQLDPGMAFGTGTHETTQLCLALLEQYVKPQVSLLDVGTGSGILAIGAAKLGAAPILAFDNDPLAVEATGRNALDNGVAALIQVQEASVAQIKQKGWDIVVVNILAHIIKTLLVDEKLLSFVAKDGVMIFSGILGIQSAEMVTAIQAAGASIVEIIEQGEWIAIIATPPL